MTYLFSAIDTTVEAIKDDKVRVLVTKSTIPPSTTAEKIGEMTGGRYPVIGISVKEHTGIDLLEQKIKELFYRGEISFNDEVYITNIRHKTALKDAYDSLEKVNISIENNMPEDFYSIDLLDAYESLGSITGETIGEDLVNEIFSKFCMGK